MGVSIRKTERQRLKDDRGKEGVSGRARVRSKNENRPIALI